MPYDKRRLYIPNDEFVDVIDEIDLLIESKYLTQYIRPSLIQIIQLNHFSCTDRFFVSGKIFSDITGCMVVYNSLNLSNHNPLPLSVSGSPPVLANSQQVNCPNGNVITWDKVTYCHIQNYHELALEQYLKVI